MKKKKERKKTYISRTVAAVLKAWKKVVKNFTVHAIIAISAAWSTTFVQTEVSYCCEILYSH